MLYALADCNNFFVSCERLFNPSLNGKPVVVLSNNDGCVISRSNEAKALGIPMGCPAFKIKEYTDPRQVIALSARHIVYHDISMRIMSILATEVENVEIYSVDEAFFSAPYPDIERNCEFLTDLVKKIYRYVGIPVSIGIAPTRTLAKIASHHAKKDPACTSRVRALTHPDDIQSVLEATPICDVWGIGRRLTDSLLSRGINTAAKFAAMPKALVRSLYSVSVERTQRELLCEDCTEPVPNTTTRKSIMNSRTFGKIIYDRDQVSDAVLYFARQCAKHLRDEHSVAGTITVYVRGDYYREDLPFYSNSCKIRLATPSSSTMTLVQYALIAFNNIYKQGYAYRKAGVLVTDLQPETGYQMNLFDSTDTTKQTNLMKAIDKINNMYGTDCVKLAPEFSHAQWKANQSHFQKTDSQLHFYGLCHPNSLKSSIIGINI